MAENKNAQQVKEITDKLEQGIKDLFESERFKEYLQTMSKFYNYSVNNTLLISMQKPDATLVAGYTSWQRNFDRHVMKGEKGIKILAPAPYKDKVEQEKLDPKTQKPIMDSDGKPVMETVEVMRPAFKVVSVFDVSQTDGKELPDIMVDKLTGSVEHYDDLFGVLKEISPVPVEFEKIESGAHGYYNTVEKRIAIDEGMSEMQNIKTLIHEIAHAKLHAVEPGEKIAPEDRKDRRTKEVEAESVAYTVCQHYGLETSDYSFGYIAGWSSDKDTKELKGSLETIRNTASDMIESIDEKLKLLVAEKEQSTEKDFLPIYTQTGSYAHEHGELDQYRQSKSENMACKEAIEKAISDNFDGMHLNPDAVKPVIESFGEERVAFVLASTIQVKDWDGRFSQSNKDWAASVPTLAEVNPDNDIRTEWAVQSHPAVLDGFVGMVRNELENSREIEGISPVSDRTEPVAFMNGKSMADIEEAVLKYAQAEIDEIGLHDDVQLHGARVYGSRTREGLYSDTSDLDVVISYSGNISEDAFFNLLHEEDLSVADIPIDINPISTEKTGTLEDYLESAEKYLDEKETAQPEQIDAPTAKFNDRKESVLQTLRDNQSKIKAQEAEKPEKKAPAKSKGKDMEL
ncbi:MAG: DUF3849 domain-containing protein [Ruminococcus sp.]|nr:DUF3849 domain-containing protein [Ruminococcus sp.]